ncbi:hypothetical protein [Oxalicibacterium faecigallinarum]|uniref:Uncharacterized protein n=1 Tax=Oxalicibacterium faecigallinarum TaxID=573741 RepID=A0A8J3AMG8_9BURK|nr:hypothetical protein [Oxalicibacterium faecigallinarum]GGI16448.1 hypothetical protein GCM10008066_04010 [Oxalicibacterium faecigallinarum]
MDLNTDQLIAGLRAAASLPPIKVPMPEWGGVVYVRPLTVAEVEAQTAVVDKDEKTKIARSTCRVLCDADGNRLLDGDNPEHVAHIAQQEWSVLQRIMNAKRQANGEGEEGLAEAKNV